MKVSIQRHGIVIKTVEITGDRARIGNTPDCEILIDDPYLSPYVADFVRVNGTWRIVDAGRLEGAQHNGVRIEDEPVVDGGTYSVGGFELVPKIGSPTSAVPRAPEPPPRKPQPRDVPKTIYSPADAWEAVPSVAPPSPAAAPIVPPTPAEPAPPAQPRSNRRVFFLAVAFGFGVIVLLIVQLTSGKKTTPVARPVVSSKPTAAVEQPPTAADEVRAGERALASLDYDTGLRHWEAALKLSPDPGLQRRYADVAVDVGRALLARGESDRGRAYLQKAIDLGPADAESVQVAKRLSR